MYKQENKLSRSTDPVYVSALNTWFSDWRRSVLLYNAIIGLAYLIAASVEAGAQPLMWIISVQRMN